MLACVSPVIGNICNAKYAATGRDFQGNKLDTVSQGLSIGGIILPFMGKIKKVATVVGDVDKIANDVNQVDRVVNDANKVDKGVNLASKERTAHILFGDGEFSGGHMAPGNLGKSIFPEAWSGDKIMKEISDIATDPTLKWTPNRVVNGIQRYSIDGVRDDVNIRVITDGKDIITAFPIY